MNIKQSRQILYGFYGTFDIMIINKYSITYRIAVQHIT